MTKLGLNSIITKFAVNQYRLHSFLVEYKALIVVIVLLKVATMFISMFAGLNYLRGIIYATIERETLSIVISLFLLVLLELITSITLAKFFKFAYRVKILTAGFIALFGVGMFFVSFQISSQGIAQYRSKQVDNVPVINQKFNVEKSNIETKANSEIAYIKEQITNIKNSPNGWINGKRSVLTTEQLKMIKDYYNQIQTTQTDRQAALNNLKTANETEVEANKTNTEHEAGKYYNIVAIIMFMQFISSAILMFFWSRIFAENDENDVIKERITDISENINNTVNTIFQNKFADVISMYNTNLSTVMKASNDKPKLSEKKNKGVIGFTAKNEIEYDTETTGATQNDTTAEYRGTIQNAAKTERYVTRKNDVRVCEYCGNEYHYNQNRQRFCSTKCRSNWHKENTSFDLEKIINSK